MASNNAPDAYQGLLDVGGQQDKTNNWMVLSGNNPRIGIFWTEKLTILRTILFTSLGPPHLSSFFWLSYAPLSINCDPCGFSYVIWYVYMFEER